MALPTIVHHKSEQGSADPFNQQVGFHAINAQAGDMILFLILGINVPTPSGMTACAGGFYYFTDQPLSASSGPILFPAPVSELTQYATVTISIHNAQSLHAQGTASGFGQVDRKSTRL